MASRAEGLEIDPDTPLTVLDDGASWFWRGTGERFGSDAEVMDIFHASQHIAAAANALHGEGTPEAAGWLEGGRGRPLSDGWPGLLDHVGATTAGGLSDAGRMAVDGLLGSSPRTPGGWATSVGTARAGRSAAGRWKGWPGDSVGD